MEIYNNEMTATTRSLK